MMERGNGWRSDRAEIETRAPFRSVKEAVVLFGEKVLAGEIYATRLRELRTKQNPLPNPQLRIRSPTLELEQTKQTLTRILQLNTILSNRIKTLTQELEHGIKEIQRLNKSCLENPEIEELKFMERNQTTTSKDVEEVELEKKRLVTFASSPLLIRVMSSVEDEEKRKKKGLERSFSVKKTKFKKGFGSFMRWFRTTH